MKRIVLRQNRAGTAKTDHVPKRTAAQAGQAESEGPATMRKEALTPADRQPAMQALCGLTLELSGRC